MVPTFQELSEAEHQWISDQLEAAARFVARHSPADADGPVTLHSLDRAFDAWMALGVTDVQAVNDAINAVGVAFGSFLVRDGSYSWVIASDEHGTDLAVLALPGTADSLVYPTNFVAKRWERRQTSFLEACFDDMIATVKSLEGHRAEGTRFQCYYSKRKIAAIALTWLLLGVLGVIVAMIGPPYAQVLAVLWVILMGAMFALGVRRLLDSSAQLTIDERGIDSRQTWLDKGVIHWENIREIYIVESQAGRFLAVDLVNRDQYAADLPPRKRRALSHNAALGQPDIVISLGDYDCTLCDAIEYLSTNHPDKLRL